MWYLKFRPQTEPERRPDPRSRVSSPTPRLPESRAHLQEKPGRQAWARRGQHPHRGGEGRCAQGQHGKGPHLDMQWLSAGQGGSLRTHGNSRGKRPPGLCSLGPAPTAPGLSREHRSEPSARRSQPAQAPQHGPAERGQQSTPEIPSRESITQFYFLQRCSKSHLL